MTAGEIIVNKDNVNDVIYVLKNSVNPDDTVNLEVKPGTIFRLDKTRKKVVGLIIEEFSKNLDQASDFSDYQLMEFFDMLLDFLNDWNTATTKR